MIQSADLLNVTQVSVADLKKGTELARTLITEAKRLQNARLAGLSSTLGVAQDADSPKPNSVITQIRERGRALLQEEFTQLIEQAQTAFAFALVGKNIAPQEQLTQLTEHLSAIITEIETVWLSLSEKHALLMIQELQQLGATKPLGIELAKEATARPTATATETSAIENVPVQTTTRGIRVRTLELLQKTLNRTEKEKMELKLYQLGMKPGSLEYQIVATLIESAQNTENFMTLVK